MDDYPRFVTPTLKPFNPIDLARETEKIVCKGDKRKYTDFYATGVYGGIATGYTVGCCLRCIFCWVDLGREFPERYGDFYSPQEAFDKLKRAAKKYGVKKMRISGAEPTLGKAHLLSLLEIFERSEFDLFILETNGMLFGADPDYVKQVAKFNRVYVRVSLKAGTPEAFTKKTGAIGEAFEIPFDAIRNLINYRARFHVAAMSADPRIMAADERRHLIEKLSSISPKIASTLEEEVVDPYETSLLRLKKAGLELKWPLKEIYKPIKI